MRSLLSYVECTELEGDISDFKTADGRTKLIYLGDVVNTASYPVDLSGARLEVPQSFTVKLT